jgi:hypothetical protein
VALGAFGDLEGGGALSYLNGTLGAGILPFALGGGPLAPLDFHLSAWDALTGVQKPAFPRVMEDWQFFTGPAIADIDGGVDGVPEIVATSGGYYVHAFDGVTGIDAAGWPKNVGQWVVMTPLVGDIDGDGLLEVVVATRAGDLHVWDVAGDACETFLGAPSVQWRKALHDEWGTGVYGRDTLRPASILDFATSDADTYTWSGVGDDGRCGASTTYEVRSLPGTVFPDWDAGTLEATLPGGADGAPQSLSLGAATRTLMLRARDEAGNESPTAVNFPEPGRTSGLAAAVALLAWLVRRRRSR